MAQTTLVDVGAGMMGIWDQFDEPRTHGILNTSNQASATASGVSPWWTLVAVLIGAAIAGAITVYVAGQNDRRALRDRQVERLRKTFAPLLYLAFAFPQVTSGMNYILEGETEEERDRRLNRLVQTASVGVDEAQVALMLEPDIRVGEIEKKFRDARKAFTTWRIAHASRTAGEIRLKQLREAEQAVTDAADGLRQAVEGLIAELDQPLPVVRRRRGLSHAG